MKNFLELTAIDTAGLLRVQVTAKVHGNVKYELKINGKCNSTAQLDLLDTIVVTCEVLDSNRGRDAVEITEITVNGLVVFPRYLHLSIPPTNWINQSGTWCLTIPAPFYVWYHHITGQGWIA